MFSRCRFRNIPRNSVAYLPTVTPAQALVVWFIFDDQNDKGKSQKSEEEKTAKRRQKGIAARYGGWFNSSPKHLTGGGLELALVFRERM